LAVGKKRYLERGSTRHLVPVSVMLFGSCHLILFVRSTNYFQIVRRQCCLSVENNSIRRKITGKCLSRKKTNLKENTMNFQICATAPQRQKGKSPGVLLPPFLVRFVGSCLTRPPFYSTCFQDQPTVVGIQRSGGSSGFDGSAQEPWWLTCHASSLSRLQHRSRICSTP